LNLVKFASSTGKKSRVSKRQVYTKIRRRKTKRTTICIKMPLYIVGSGVIGRIASDIGLTFPLIHAYVID
jgi:hypothetical protein